MTFIPPSNRARLPRRACPCLAIAVVACYFLVSAATALAVDTGRQDAATDQGATANGLATQSGPTNIVITVRIDSPGDDGAVSQTNVTVVGAVAANDSGTTQTGGQDQAAPAPEQGATTDQGATTEQDAAADAEGTQSQPTNIVISVRINSPGDNGPVSQTNAAVVGADANNNSTTTQDGSATDPVNTPKTAVPQSEGLRHGAALAEAADSTTASSGRRSAPRPSARVPNRARGHAAKSLGRPNSGAAAAHSAGFPAAAARAFVPRSEAGRSVAREGAAGRPAAHKSIFVRTAEMLGGLAAAVPAAPRTGQPPARLDLVTLTAIALLGALLLWASSAWLEERRAVWRRR